MKELSAIADVVTAPAARRFVKRYRSWTIPLLRPLYRVARQHRSAEAIFTEVYETNRWGDHFSVSGSGSNLVHTAALREELPGVLAAYGVRTLLDVPCGDFQWLSRTALQLDRYTGADVVEELVQRNRETYGDAMPYPCTFVKLDLTRDDLPQADLVLCRDLFVHFSYENIWKALERIRASGSRYLLTTTFTDRTSNRDNGTGGWRPLNLTCPPFNFPPPLHVLNERCTERNGTCTDKSLGLWQVADLPAMPRP